ncbi:NAD-dependent epimerase/dehydratase family protein [Plectonema cf. radiosum LEGE 06105]|uniref:NAD-dependent epimerase/dehydratase family protein n=1 Tax=Plectonema cf. radiosum LEGE 06105 TaxID=945769 RepID=A0A8J7F7M2_9CYAN|nr:NAD-dependent epimerase/dehydratase family protein [Plectonema radiosum]MBE9216273.1 NAD-dependent epimerase/dehydratase family protein [Plectonema cf. radiosum LEGE 06105]
MKALVTGANGFTGSHLVKALRQRGDSVVGLVRKSSNLTRLKDTEMQLVIGDITERNALRQAMKDVDTVFHTAAFVELGLVDAAQMERVNVEGTQAVLEVAKEMEISKMVYCSTIGIYGDTKGKVINETFKRTQKNFSSAYDSTKYKAQQLVDDYAVIGLPVVSVMPSGILGADDPHFGPVFKLFLQGKLKFWVGGDRITGVVHVDDLVNAMILAAEKGERGEHYIISAGEVPSREMFEIISKQTGISTPGEVPQPIVRVIGNILDPIGKILSWNPPIGKERVHYLYDRCVRVDASKAREKLGWQPRGVSQILQEIATQLQ